METGKRRKGALVCVLLAASVIGGTSVGAMYAYHQDSGAITNTLTVGSLGVDTVEVLSGLTKSEIGLYITGRSDCYLRMRVEVPDVAYTYVSEGEEVTAEAEVLLNDGTKLTASEWKTYESPMKAIVEEAEEPGEIENASWERYGDYWYLSVPLSSGDTAYLLQQIMYPGLWSETEDSMVSPLPDGISEGMLTVPVMVDAVQVKGMDVGGAEGALAAYEAFRKLDPETVSEEQE